MMMETFKRQISTVFAAVLLSGCVSYTANQDSVRVDVPSDQFLQQVTLGETTTDWLVQQLGQPTAVRQPGQHQSVWQYENVLSKTTKVRAFPLFALNMTHQHRTLYNFAVENNYVVRYWVDTEK